MNTYRIPNNIDKWDLENGFYLTCENHRISKFLTYSELYKMILDLPGDFAEFGVYKGSSFIQFLSLRQYYENSESRSFLGFDAFGKFPSSVKSDYDKSFIEKFETNSGNGISDKDLDTFLKAKNLDNYSLIKGDIIETLPEYIENNSQRKFSLIHIDVDVYEPVKCILEQTWNKLVKGGVIILDDYGRLEGETQAIDEFFEDKNILIQKLPYKYKPSFIVKQ